MDGRGGHPVVQKDDGDRMDRIQKLMDKGVGWVNLHYAVDYLPQHGKTRPRLDGRLLRARTTRSTRTGTPRSESLPKHPITRGVKPFTLRDEWYYNMRFAGRT